MKSTVTCVVTKRYGQRRNPYKMGVTRVTHHVTGPCCGEGVYALRMERNVTPFSYTCYAVTAPKIRTWKMIFPGGAAPPRCRVSPRN
jgi:hypothetical protein